MIRHTVASGEYLSLIAARYGVPWEKVWLAPENQELRNKRQSPDILYPGDVVMIPDREAAEVDVPAEAKHRFKLKGTPREVHLKLLDDFGEPLQDLPFEADIAGRDMQKNEIGSDGLVKLKIPWDADEVGLRFPSIGMAYTLRIGDLDPVSHLRGVQQRLKALGFDPGPFDGIHGPLTRRALLRFQKCYQLTPTGLADRATRDELEVQHEGKQRGLALEDEEGNPVDVEVLDHSAGATQPLENELPDFEVEDQELGD